MSISAVVAIRDENETFLKSLQSLEGFADEIVIADIGMSKDMLEKAGNIKGVRVVKYPTPMYIELIRQEVIDSAKGDWIFYLDPDEVLTEKLKHYLLGNVDNADYFSIPRKNIILGHWMEHSRWWPDYQIRFLRKGHVTWGKKIHAQPETKGTGIEVPSEEGLAIEHYNYLNYDQYLEKSHRYAKGEAKNFPDLTLMEALQRGMSEFISRYFKDEGYKDGMHGFVMAFSQLMYYFQVYVYIWEGRKYVTKESVEQVPAKFFSQGLYETLHWMKERKLIGKFGSKFKYFVLKQFKSL